MVSPSTTFIKYIAQNFQFIDIKMGMIHGQKGPKNTYVQFLRNIWKFLATPCQYALNRPK